MPDLLLQIQELQEEHCLSNSGLQRGTRAQSLQYLTTLTVDLTKLISVSYQKANLPAGRLRELLCQMEKTEEKPLVKVATELFRNFVAYEPATRAHVLYVIKEHIWSLMDARERSALFSTLVREFLSKPERTFSQKSIVDSLDSLSIPACDLILFLSRTLGLAAAEEQTTEQEAACPLPSRPLVMVSSILILAIKGLERADSKDAEGPAGLQAFRRI